jgi:hypothetical protein
MDANELLQALKYTLGQTQEEINMAEQALTKVISYSRFFKILGARYARIYTKLVDYWL